MDRIDEMLEKLGDSFRGLWRSKEVYIDGKTKSWGWSVTFIYKGEIVETSYTESPEIALKYAIYVIGKE